MVLQKLISCVNGEHVRGDKVRLKKKPHLFDSSKSQKTTGQTNKSYKQTTRGRPTSIPGTVKAELPGNQVGGRDYRMEIGKEGKGQKILWTLVTRRGKEKRIETTLRGGRRMKCLTKRSCIGPRMNDTKVRKGEQLEEERSQSG